MSEAGAHGVCRVSKRRLETDKSIDGRQLIQDFETGSIVEDEDADAPNEADAGTAATSPLAPFTQLPMPDTAMQARNTQSACAWAREAGVAICTAAGPSWLKCKSVQNAFHNCHLSSRTL